MKKNRQQLILSIIEKYEIDTQEALMQRLAEEGVETTQTTLSRDIRQMKLVKTMTASGKYKYVTSDVPGEETSPKIGSALTESIKKMQAAGNMVVIRTHAGMANAIAVFVDSLGLSEIVGCVAGDDTILIVLPDESTAREILEKIRLAFDLDK